MHVCISARTTWPDLAGMNTRRGDRSPQCAKPALGCCSVPVHGHVGKERRGGPEGSVAKNDTHGPHRPLLSLQGAAQPPGSTWAKALPAGKGRSLWEKCRMGKKRLMRTVISAHGDN